MLSWTLPQALRMSIKVVGTLGRVVRLRNLWISGGCGTAERGCQLERDAAELEASALNLRLGLPVAISKQLERQLE